VIVIESVPLVSANDATVSPAGYRKSPLDWHNKTSLQPSWGGNENGVHGFHENLYFPVLPFCSAVNLGPDLPPSIGCKLIIWPLDLFQEQLSILEQEYEL